MLTTRSVMDKTSNFRMAIVTLKRGEGLPSKLAKAVEKFESDQEQATRTAMDNIYPQVFSYLPTGKCR